MSVIKKSKCEHWKMSIIIITNNNNNNNDDDGHGVLMLTLTVDIKAKRILKGTLPMDIELLITALIM